jgi:hypothetical protein
MMKNQLFYGDNLEVLRRGIASGLPLSLTQQS